MSEETEIEISYDKNLNELAQVVVVNPLEAKRKIQDLINDLSAGLHLSKKQINELLARANSILTTAEIRLGEYENALASANSSLKLYRKLKNGEGIARSLVNLGIVNGIVGKHNNALDLFKDALVYYKDAGEKSREAQTLVFLGNAYSGSGDYASALEHYTSGLAIHREINDKQGISDAQVNLGLIFQRMGEFAKAIEFYNESFILKKEIGDNYGEARTLQNIATIYLSQGQYADAVKTLNECKTIFEGINDKQGISMVHTNIGAAHIRLSDYTHGLEHFQAALTIQREIGDLIGESRSLAYMGGAFLRIKDIPNAIDKYKQALTLQEENSDDNTIAQTLLGLGSAYIENNDLHSALECFSMSLQYQHSAGDKFGSSRSHGNLCRIYLLLGNPTKAFEHLQQAMIFHRQLGDKEGEAESLLYLGELSELAPEAVKNFSGEFASTDDLHLTEAILVKALGIAQEIGSKTIEQSVFSRISKLFESRGMYQQSLEYFKKSLEIEKTIANTEISQRMSFLHSVFEAEQSKKEAEIYRLKNVELAELNDEISRQKDKLQEQAGEIKVANKELRKKNRLLQAYISEKDKMLGLVAHDLKSPISGVRMIGEYICSSYKQMDSEMFFELGNDIKNSTSRMFDTISNLLEIQQLETGKIKPVMKKMDLTDAVRSSVAQYTVKAQLKGISIEEKYPSSPCVVTLDHDYCVRIVKNLLSNAIKYSALNESVSVSLEVVSHKQFRTKKVALVTVKDFGPGILIEEMPKLFKKFTKLSARPTGGEHSSGIGLSIVKQLVESQGGKVWCESIPEKGATFYVEFLLSH